MIRASIPELEVLELGMDALAKQGLDQQPRFKLAAALLTRAQEQRAGVAEVLLNKIRQHLAVLEGQAPLVNALAETEDANASAGASSSGLSDIIRALNQSYSNPEPEKGHGLSASMGAQEQAIFGQASDQQTSAWQEAGLSELANQDQSQIKSAAQPKEQAEEKPQLKAVQNLRRNQARQNHQRRISAALDAQPENPGPLNPQMLAIKSLSHMRDLSPQYLNRFIAYIETLTVLDMAAGSSSHPNKKAPKPRKKR